MKDTTATLPESWAPATIGEICTALQYGYTASASDEPCGPRFLRITDIQNGFVQWPSVPYCQIESALIQKYQLHPGDIVFARTGGTVGKSFIISFIPEPSVFASYLIRLSAHSNVEPKYLYYFFQTASYWEQIGLKKGGLQGNVNATTLSSLELSICPLNEQHRIVAKIEELFSELDKGIENLKTAQAQLKVYRQALLKHAFEGKLTAQWREQHRDQLETAAALQQRIQRERTQRYQQQLADWQANGGSKPKAPKPLPPLTAEELAELPELPEGWGWVKSGELFEPVTSGSRGWAEYYADSGAIFIRITNMDFDSLKLDLSPKKIQYVKPPVGAEGLRTKVKEGDFLFSITGYLGMFAIAPALDDAYVNQHISLARPLEGFSKKYFGYYATSHTGGIHYLNKQTKGAVKAGLGLDDIQNFPVPLCSFEEQIQIASELELRLSEIDQLELTLTTSLQQAEALRQSILKKAFSGQLVPQDPHDEPASVLLARIRAERATVAVKPRRNLRSKLAKES